MLLAIPVGMNRYYERHKDIRHRRAIYGLASYGTPPNFLARPEERVELLGSTLGEFF
jgi:hypothetical protein